MRILTRVTTRYIINKSLIPTFLTYHLASHYYHKVEIKLLLIISNLHLSQKSHSLFVCFLEH